MAGAGSQIITSVKKLEAIKEPVRYRAGEGLYLEVGRTAASRSWILRVTVQGKRRDIGLGGYPAVGLAEARDRAN